MPRLAFGFFYMQLTLSSPSSCAPPSGKDTCWPHPTQLLLNVTQDAQSQPDHDLWPPHSHYSPLGELPPWPHLDPSFLPQAPLNCSRSAMVEMPIHRRNPSRTVHEQLGGDTSTCLGPLCCLSSQQQCIKAFA